MIETERQILAKNPRTEFIYEEEFYDQVICGCFLQKKIVVIKKRTLYLYCDRQDYLERPEQPFIFFNLNHMNCTLNEDNIQISNHFTQITLKHSEPTKLLKLLEAIGNGRTMIGPEELYPKKFVYFESAELQEFKDQ